MCSFVWGHCKLPVQGLLSYMSPSSKMSEGRWSALCESSIMLEAAQEAIYSSSQLQLHACVAISTQKKALLH